MVWNFVDTEMSTQTTVVRNQPTAVVCRNEDIFIDPTCMDDIDKCQFVIHRYESNLNALKQDGRYENLGQESALLLTALGGAVVGSLVELP